MASSAPFPRAISFLFWFKACRANLWVVLAVAMCVNVGMWFERFVIVVTSLHRDYLPSSWASYTPTSIEVATLLGSFGLFFSAFLLFCRFVPVIAIAEVKAVVGTPAHALQGHGPARAASVQTLAPEEA